MNILNKPTATYAQCETWLRKKTDCQLAHQCLPILWKAAVSNGIDPVVLIAQAMTETGFFKFGGVIDASYKNTCGLKTTKGGGDYAASAHMRFKSWEDGIQAHSDHLALYNGTTKDPRHFPYLHGKCKTVKSLKGTWATDPQYDVKLEKMINDIRNTKEGDCPASNITPAKKKVDPLGGIKKGIKQAATNPFFKKKK